MTGQNSIGLHLPVHDKVWIVIEESCLPEVKDAVQLGVMLYTKEDASKAIKNGYKVAEVDWCRFQSLLQQMRL